MRTKIKRVHIVGHKNSGKTTLIVDLVQHLASQGYRVGTMKHTITTTNSTRQARTRIGIARRALPLLAYSPAE